jgi:hypothetical protein
MPDQDDLDPGPAPERWHRIVSYDAGEDGNVRAVENDGFEASIMVHSEAWLTIEAEVAEARRMVEAGEASPISYYMSLNLFETRLLSRYVGMCHWRVKRHLRPEIFRKLPDRILARYVRVFVLPSIDALRTLPETDVIRIRPEPGRRFESR